MILITSLEDGAFFFSFFFFKDEILIEVRR